MSPVIIALVLMAALLHATWNAMLKRSGDRRWTTIAMQFGPLGIAGVVAMFLPFPAAHSWPWLLAGAVLHIGYQVFLVWALGLGELGEIYPISRGASPMLVAAGAALTTGDHLSWRQGLGIIVVSVGIISLRRGGGRRLPLTALGVALGTAAFTAGYTVVDSLGARGAGPDPAHLGAYLAWLSVLDGLCIGGFFLLAVPPLAGDPKPDLRQTLVGAAAGLISMIAYGVVILATTLGAMGAVSALRETSVLFAALIGAVFLGERLTVVRLAACATIVAGAFLIALA
jgi:drug/metabolite transporter (DMT)-like permease